MNNRKKTFPCVTLLTPILLLAMVSTFIACGNDKVAGTDEQQNSVTANLDSELIVWLAGDSLIPAKISGPSFDCPHDVSNLGCSHDFPSIDTSATQPPKFPVENGSLYHVSSESFESIVCENESNWFVYSVSAIDSVIQKGLTLPDSATAEAFESDCEEEGGTFVADTAAIIEGQHNFHCSLTILADEESGADSTRYFDANWKKYVELIVGICRN